MSHLMYLIPDPKHLQLVTVTQLAVLGPSKREDPPLQVQGQTVAPTAHDLRNMDALEASALCGKVPGVKIQG
jgi:hypothetical protein